MTERRRVAAVIMRDGCVLMVRERGRGPTGRHDGPELGVDADLGGRVPADGRADLGPAVARHGRRVGHGADAAQ